VRGDSDFPCIELAFDLTSNGRSVATERERVCDRNCLTFRRVDLRYSPNDPMVYEKITYCWLPDQGSNLGPAD